jgi:RNA polymerase sigma factor (sigma-70 family)
MNARKRKPLPEELDDELLLVSAIEYILHYGGQEFLELIAHIKEGSTKAFVRETKMKLDLRMVELDAPTTEEGDELIDFMESPAPAPDHIFANEETKQLLGWIIDTLSPQEADIVRRRFGMQGHQPHTLEEIGQFYHVTRERIRQIEANALRKLKYKLGRDGLSLQSFI